MGKENLTQNKFDITRAKDLSLIGIILTVICAVISNIVFVILKKDFPDIDKEISILLFSSCFMLPFSPVYFNLFLDKIFGRNKGNIQ